MQLVWQCFGVIVAAQVARNISQCDIPRNGQNRCETSSTKSRTFKILLSATALATCLATILAVAGYVTLRNVARNIIYVCGATATAITDLFFSFFTFYITKQKEIQKDQFFADDYISD